MKTHNSPCCMRTYPLTEEEIDKYQFLKTITDTKRLHAMLPSWIKRELSPAPKTRAEFVPGLPPRFPAWCAFKMPVFYLKIPNFVTADPNPTIAYIAEFNRLNGPYK